MPILRGLLFDVDGTLAETERDGHRVAFNGAFASYGLDWYWSEALYGELLQVTGGRERIAHYAGQRHPHWLAQEDSAKQIAAIHRDKNRRYAALLAAEGIGLRPGLLTLIRAARDAGLRLGIVTTTSRDNLRALLDAGFDTDLRSSFGLQVCGEDVTRKKPDPECYRLALGRLRLPPQQVLAIEDSRNGLSAASAAGLRTLIVRSAYFKHHDFDGALQVVDAFTQTSLPALARRFEQQVQT